MDSSSPFIIKNDPDISSQKVQRNIIIDCSEQKSQYSLEQLSKINENFRASYLSQISDLVDKMNIFEVETKQAWVIRNAYKAFVDSKNVALSYLLEQASLATETVSTEVTDTKEKNKKNNKEKESKQKKTK